MASCGCSSSLTEGRDVIDKVTQKAQKPQKGYCGRNTVFAEV